MLIGSDIRSSVAESARTRSDWNFVMFIARLDPSIRKLQFLCQNYLLLLSYIDICF